MVRHLMCGLHVTFRMDEKEKESNGNTEKQGTLPLKSRNTLLATQIKTDLNINKVKEVARRFLQQDFFSGKKILSFQF
jgi:hypothetical protein